MPLGTNLDNVVRSISSKQIPEDSMSPVTTFEGPVSISDPPVTTCEAPVGPAPPEKRPRTWEYMAAAAGVIIMTSADNEEPNLEPVQKKKKMTPKEYRQMKPKPKTSPSITLSDKKNFKEGFNTDKSRLMKIQTKYGKPENYLLLVENNIHTVGSGSETAGKVMAFAAGPLKEKFLGEGIKYNDTEYFLHANYYDFSKENVTRSQM